MNRTSLTRCLKRSLLLMLLAVPAGFTAAFAGSTDQPFVAPTATVDKAQKQVQRQQTQPGNNAPVWREVRSGDVHQTQIKGVETGVLVQPAGETWRALRNGPISLYGGLFLVGIFAVIGLFHWRHGPIKLHGAPSGKLIARFSDWDRMMHWTTAISFLILAISGLILLFGKYVLLPMFGFTLFSWLAILSKNLHNFVGPLFIIAALTMVVTFFKDNLWKSYDFRWFRNMGGMLGGEHVPSGKFNAGEKVWFWLGLFLLTLVMGTTGLVLDFPNFDQGRSTMQDANMIHAIAAIVYMAVSLGHIYMGSIGVEGAYESMRIQEGKGMVDEAWAKEHHELWYNDVKAGKVGKNQKPVGGVATSEPLRQP